RQQEYHCAMRLAHHTLVKPARRPIGGHTYAAGGDKFMIKLYAKKWISVFRKRKAKTSNYIIAVIQPFLAML
ncbi:MAG: hypothetical protein ACK5NN_03130, partial [Sphingomonadaceae bacterium]